MLVIFLLQQAHAPAYWNVCLVFICLGTDIKKNVILVFPSKGLSKTNELSGTGILIQWACKLLRKCGRGNKHKEPPAFHLSSDRIPTSKQNFIWGMQYTHLHLPFFFFFFNCLTWYITTWVNIISDKCVVEVVAHGHSIQFTLLLVPKPHVSSWKAAIGQSVLTVVQGAI